MKINQDHSTTLKTKPAYSTETATPTQYRYGPHNDVSVNDGLHIRGWSHKIIILYIILYCRSQWPRGLRRRSAADRLLRSWVPIPPGAWMFVCCECCVLSGRGLYDELITRPEESYRLWCVVLCDLETSRKRRP